MLESDVTLKKLCEKTLAQLRQIDLVIAVLTAHNAALQAMLDIMKAKENEPRQKADDIDEAAK